MASWTDAITQFNPYVSTLPVEAMVKVGMEKQRRYDEGYAKIQAQIDQVAGLDVIRDVDKNYLQSKLNELGGRLKTFAASDFSNYQLVNSVAGMAKQVASDEDVQNAVASTTAYRKEMKRMEEAKANGKSNVANEDLFITQTSSWLSGKSVKDKFNAKYTPYTDVFKKLGEIATSVGEDSTIVQQLFQTDKNGNPILDKKGNLQYNDVMAETLLKGKDKNKLLQAFQTGLNADDYRQLSISGRYSLKGRSKEELSKDLIDGFTNYEKVETQRKDFIQDKIVELKTKGGDKNMISALENQVLQIDENVKKRKNSLEGLLSADEDTLKGSIYTNNYLDTLSSAFSTKETYTKYMKNPAVEMMMDREKMKLEANKFRLEQDKFTYQQLEDVKDREFQTWKALFEKGLVDEKGKPTGAGLYTGPARDLPILDQTNSLYFTDQFKTGLDEDTKAQFGMYEKVAVADWMVKNSSKINPNTGKGYTEAEMKQQIGAHAKKLGMSYNDYVVLQGQKATDKYNSTKGQYLGAEFAQTFQSINELGQTIGIKKKQMDAEADYISKNAAGFTPTDLKNSKVGKMKILTSKGSQIELSEGDVIDLAKYMYHYKTDPNVPKFFDSKAVRDDAKSAEQRLIRKYGQDGFNQIVTNSGYDPGGSTMSMWNMRTVGGKRNILTGETYGAPLTNAINLLKNNDYKQSLKLREEYYKGISQVGVPKGVVLYKDKSETKEHLASALASIASDYSGIDSEYATIASLANEDKAQFQINITPAASRYGKNTYELQVTKPDGSIITKPIKEKDYTYLTGKQAPSLLVNDAISTINSSQFGSTNLGYYYTDPNAYSTAFVKDYQTKTNNYNIGIDYVMSGENQFYPKIYVQMGEDNWKLFPYNAPLTEQGIVNFPSQVDDVFIKSLLQISK
jgi:hypothetical protein